MNGHAEKALFCSHCPKRGNGESVLEKLKPAFISQPNQALPNQSNQQSYLLVSHSASQ